MADFKVGDVVRLKSGGPKMTVISIDKRDDGPMLWCSWFEGPTEYKGRFPTDAVEKF